MLYFWHSVGNRLLTMLSNMFSDLNLTDMETCYKVMVRKVADRLDLQSRDFGIEPEITQKVAAMRARIYEVPISYHGRTYEEGKKIGLKDAFKAVYTILRFWGWRRRPNNESTELQKNEGYARLLYELLNELAADFAAGVRRASARSRRRCPAASPARSLPTN